jgi:acyl-CoA synthetase (AMP-forming)/AMP-acid ligase II
MSGYLNRPDLTEAALAAGRLRTGDRGRIDDRGIWFAGRIKDEINRAGFKIQPAENRRDPGASPRGCGSMRVWNFRFNERRGGRCGDSTFGRSHSKRDGPSIVVSKKFASGSCSRPLVLC